MVSRAMSAIIQMAVFIGCHLPCPAISYARHEDITSSHSVSGRRKCPSNATESLNENDLSRSRLRFCQSERIYRDKSLPLRNHHNVYAHRYARKHI